MTPPWRVKYDGVCSRCGTVLTVGTPAVYERASRTIHCIECPTAAANEMALAATEAPADAAPRPDEGLAGGSARREHERRMAAREARTRDRFGHRLGRVVLALTSEPQSTRAWAIGAKGEEKLAAALQGIDGLCMLHDRRVPGTRGNIDHIVIAPTGIFVIDAKNYEGLIRVRDVGGLFRTDNRLYVGSRDCSKLADNLGWQVEAVVAALGNGGVDPLPPITPVLCFVDGEWPLLRPPDSFRGVRLESERSIRKVLTASATLKEVRIKGLARVLATALPAK